MSPKCNNNYTKLVEGKPLEHQVIVHTFINNKDMMGINVLTSALELANAIRGAPTPPWPIAIL